MLGIRIISQYALNELLNKARIKGERNSVSTIQRLNDKLEQLEMENFSLINKNYSLKLSEDLNDKIMNQSLHGESLLRTAIRELIELYNDKAPKISITNEDLIKELKDLTSENFKIFTKQAQLLVDVAENKSIESITAVEEYLATFNFDSNEE
jgi:hypothetical protein